MLMYEQTSKDRKRERKERTTLFLLLFIKRLHLCLNIMSLVAVKKRKSGKNRKDRNKWIEK